MNAPVASWAALPATVRADAMDAATQRYDVENFFDLGPAERRAVYEQATDDFWARLPQITRALPAATNCPVCGAPLKADGTHVTPSGARIPAVPQ